ncbi:UDP-N-acetylmuramoyl-L-alanyl-D-glutamate--2,6-diaminopimelate ligase [soil metagenome]
MRTPFTMNMSALADRLRAEDLLLAEIGADVELTGIADDSRYVEDGDLFCAWSGTASDSHRFASDVVAAGVRALLVERELTGVRTPQLVVRNGRRAAAVAASAFYGDPQRRLRLVGVTGTNGKTTTVWVLRHVLSQRAATASLGTLGTILEDGSTLPGSEALTTPGPVDLARTLHVLAERGVRDVAMEVSSHALDQGRVQALRFHAAAFMNLSRDHLDYHGTLEAYLIAKRSLIRLLRPDGCAIINADDQAWSGLAVEARRSLTFGVEAPADVAAADIEYTAGGVGFELRTRQGGVRTRLPLPGAFNVQNALAAAATCLALGFSLTETAAALESVPQVPGRLELIADEPCAVIRDYAHTPDALERVLQALRPLTASRLIVVFGAGGDRDSGKRPFMGAVAERLSDVAIVTSDNPRTEDADAIIDDIEAGMGLRRHVRITDRRSAIAHALEMAESRDIVLLAGKGHETYQIIGDEKLPFDERTVVAELIAAREVTP